MPLHYFIFYRVRPGMAEQAGAMVAAMQVRLAADTGVVGRFLRRADDVTTCMEAYQVTADTASFDRALARNVAQTGLADLLAPGEVRHLEKFVECA